MSRAERLRADLEKARADLAAAATVSETMIASARVQELEAAIAEADGESLIGDGHQRP